MKTTATPSWESQRTDETRSVEELLGKHFQQVDSYRYNSASIRVRVIDPRFERKSRERRVALVDKQLAKLPEATQRDIVTLFAFAPSELQGTPANLSEQLLNAEFIDPSPSTL